jgi:hypothetical protein
MWIRMLLVVAVGLVSLALLKGHRGARHQALRRLSLLAFALVAGLSVLFPQAWQRAAEAVGVGRGTDLLLYGLIVAFLGFVATSYLRFRDLQHQVTELARRLALDEAPAPRSTRHLRVVGDEEAVDTSDVFPLARAAADTDAEQRPGR